MDISASGGRWKIASGYITPVKVLVIRTPPTYLAIKTAVMTEMWGECWCVGQLWIDFKDGFGKVSISNFGVN